MKDILITVKSEVKNELYGRVSDFIWEKYQNGEITPNALFLNYFREISTDSVNLKHDVMKIEEF